MKSLLVLCAFLFSTTALAGKVLLKLPKNNALAKVTSEINFKWTENNISTGTSTVDGVILVDSMPELEKARIALATDLYKDVVKARVGGPVPMNTVLKVTAAKFKKASIAAAVRAVSDANAYDPTNAEIKKSLTEEIESMLSVLGDADDFVTFAVSAKLDDDSSGEKRTVAIHAFVNEKTSKMVLIFTVEGTI